MLFYYYILVCTQILYNFAFSIHYTIQQKKMVIKNNEIFPVIPYISSSTCRNTMEIQERKTNFYNV